MTQKQVDRINLNCIYCKRPWTEKIDFCIKLIKPFYKDITPENLKWFLEEFVPSEEKRLRKQYFIDCQTGKRNTNITPTDVDGSFGKVEIPHIGVKYHISWAFKGACFVLKRLDDDGIHGYVDNPKHKREKLLKIKLSDLRKLRQ